MGHVACSVQARQTMPYSYLHWFDLCAWLPLAHDGEELAKRRGVIRNHLEFIRYKNQTKKKKKKKKGEGRKE